MKKALTRTIIVLIIVNLITAGFTLAQDVIEEENQQVLEAQKKEADVTQREAEIAAKAAEREAEVAVKVAERQAEVAAKVAERQAMIAEKQMEATEKQLSIAEDRMMYDEMLRDLRVPEVTLPHLPHFQHSGGGGVLVIPSAQMKVENLATITEDMSVMSRIFDKQLSQANVAASRGRLFGEFNPVFVSGNRTTEAIYLEGYGALFLMKINMLLSAPPEAQKKEKTKEEDTDPVWSQMRREMYEPEEARRSRTNDRPEEKYDAEKVETLKTNLIKTLKHATNIQALSSDQLVILTVIGDGRRSGATITQSFSYGRSTGSRSRRIVQTAPEAETDSIVPTVLTICAKKSDIDAFAKGELDYDQFRQRTGIFKSYAKAEQHSPGAEVDIVAHEVHR